MAKIYTKRGDEGDTGLLYGGRVRKTDPHCVAFGAVDEANSVLGLARSLSKDAWVQDRLMEVQRDLFTVGSELATAPDFRDRLLEHFPVVTAEMTARLEKLIDQIDEQIELPRSFIVPGGSPASAAIDMGRSAMRRAEREAVRLLDLEKLANPEVPRYLNRLTDFLFMLARFEDREDSFEALGSRARSKTRSESQ